MKYLLAHDIGTSGNKATLFAEDGRLLDSNVYAYETRYFNGNWAEQDAEDWWKAVCISTKMLLKKTAVDPRDILCVSFSGQMMGCLCVDKTGTPLRRAIIWADQRAVRQSEKIGAVIPQKEFYRIVGHRNTASYGVQKLMWVKENEPEIYEKTYKVLNAKDYICFKLTGEYGTDYSDANSMACFDINRLEWSDEIIRAAGIQKDKLPDVHASTHVAGTIHRAAAYATGLTMGTPVVIGAGDGVAANVGAGSILPGRTYCCMGTSAWITTTTLQPAFDEEMRLVTWVHAIPGYYAPNGTMQMAGGALGWVKDTICRWETEKASCRGCSPYEFINAEVAESIPGANGITFLPYLLGERAPLWDPDIRGAFLGLGAENTREDILRSVMEGVIFNLDMILKILRQSTPIDEILAIGGGAKSDVWCQIMADIFGTVIKVPNLMEEAGSMGAAVIGGVGIGLYPDFGIADQMLKIRRCYQPDEEAAQYYGKIKPLFTQYYNALRNINR